MVVMKFGGTSVRDAEAVRRVVSIVGREKRPRVVVVSALSGVTDGLLDIAAKVESGDPLLVQRLFDRVTDRLDDLRDRVRNEPPTKNT